MLSVYVEVLAIPRTCGVDSRPRHADEGDELDDLGNVAKIGLDLFERAHLVLRLSPRLRAKHGD